MTDTSSTGTTPSPVAAEPDDDKGDYLDLRPNGGVHLVVDGVKHRLRSPRMRDYRKLVGIWRDEAEALEAKSEELQGFLEAMLTAGDEREKEGKPRLTEEDRATDRRLGMEIRELTEDAAIRWWTEAVATLGVTDRDREVEADDLPVFCATVESVNDVLGHWRSVPSRSGAR